jgi:hypothetical protein
MKRVFETIFGSSVFSLCLYSCYQLCSHLNFELEDLGDNRIYLALTAIIMSLLFCFEATNGDYEYPDPLAFWGEISRRTFFLAFAIYTSTYLQGEIGPPILIAFSWLTLYLIIYKVQEVQHE